MKNTQDLILVVVVLFIAVFLGIGMGLRTEQKAHAQIMFDPVRKPGIEKRCLDGYVYYLIFDRYGVGIVQAKGGADRPVSCPKKHNFIFERAD